MSSESIHLVLSNFSSLTLTFWGFILPFLSASASPLVYPLLSGASFLSYSMFFWMFIDFLLRLTSSFCKSLECIFYYYLCMNSDTPLPACCLLRSRQVFPYPPPRPFKLSMNLKQCRVFHSNLYIFTHFICVSLWRVLASTTDACNFSVVWPQCQHITEM